MFLDILINITIVGLQYLVDSAISIHDMGDL